MQINDETIRDTAQKEIVFEAVTHRTESGGIYLNNPLDLGLIHFWESQEMISLSGVDCNTGTLFDTNDRTIRYCDLPTILLLKIHRIIVDNKQYH